MPTNNRLADIDGFVADAFTLTTTTPGLTIARNRPVNAIGAEVLSVFATTVLTPTWNFTPRLKKAWYFDDSLASYTDITASMRDRFTAATDINSAEGAADPYKDFIYLCCMVPFSGAYIDVTNVNGTASVMHALYPTAQGTWAGLTETDGTAAGGVTLAQDAAVTWTMPTNWVATSEGPTGQTVYGYWIRIGFTVTLDSATSIANIIPIPVQTGGKMTQGGLTTDASRPLLPQQYFFNPNAVGGIVASGANAEIVRVTWLCKADRGGQVVE